jgi:PAS domain S-box-containing protein
MRPSELELQIEELRRTKAELETSLRRYLRLYELAPVGYLTMGRNMEIREINPAGAEMLQCHREELIGRPFSGFIAQQDLPILTLHRNEILEHRGKESCELRLSIQDEIIWIHLVSAPLPDSPDDIEATYSAFMDISHPNVMEERLARFHRRDYAFADGAPEIIAMTGRDLRFTYVNPAAEHHLSIPRESFCGKTPEELGMPAPLCRAWAQALRTGKAQTLDFEYSSAGAARYFHASLVPDTDDPDTVETAVGFIRDFTFLRNIHVKLEEEVLERTAELEKINVELRNEITRREKFEKALQFSTTQIIEYSRRRKHLSRRLVELLEQDRRDMAMALHDHIGQILTTLKMDLELLRRKVKDEDVREIMESAIEKASQAMSFSRNISQELRPAMLDTLGLVPSVESLITQVRQSSGLKITFFHRSIAGKLGNEKDLTLYRILQEALTNVLKHASAQSVNITLIRKGGSVLLTVEDDGAGFDQKKVTASDKGPLGIMIMKERAVQAGGTVDIETRPGKGTHLTARIPVQETA